MSLLRSISGLRATLGSDLTPQLIAEYTSAFSTMLSEGPIVIGRDGRPSGNWIEEIVLGTLRACNRPIRSLGMVPTPTVQLLTEKSDAVGGIVVTASHNSAEWNGLKFLDRAGIFLDDVANESMWRIVDSHSQVFSDRQQSGSVEYITDAIQQHIEVICKVFNIDSKLPSQNIGSMKRVVVDAVNCSGSVIVPHLLTLLGYQPVPLYCDGSGSFPHPPEPIAGNLEDLGRAVIQYDAAFGVAVDPDADRLVLFNEHGDPIGEELTIALSVMAALEKQPADNSTVVVNYSTTRTVDDVAQRYGAHTVRAAVGEINVVRKMLATGALIGGEGSGGVVYPRVHAGRDSLVGIALICGLLNSSGKTLSELCNSIPKYAMVKRRVELRDRTELPNVLSKLEKFYSHASMSKEDGLHLSWADRWIHVRASNTEPILRLIAEAPTDTDAATLIGNVEQHVNKMNSGVV
ncbi:MAG: phosphoglucosamine mutase [Ignavibacteria bacterium]|nr:phosphoglucosamine mutase [Ignavibacteria bacterium]